MQTISAYFRKIFDQEYSERTLLLISLALLLLVFSPALIFGKIFLDGDTISYTYPAFYFLKYHAGEMLNPLTFGGYPVTAAFHIGVFNPIYQIFSKLFDYLLAYHLILFIDYAAAFLFTYYFLKGLGGSMHASLLSAYVFVLGQWGFYWMSSVNLSHSMYLLPALLLCVQKVSEKKYGFGVLSAILLWLNLTYTHYQFVLMALIFAGCYALYLTRKILPLGIFAASCAAGLFLALPQFLRTFHFLPLSMRAAFFLPASVWYFDMFRYLVPSFQLPGSTQEYLPYIGIVPLMLLTLALVRIRKEGWSPHGKFFLWSFIIINLLVFKYSPFFYLFTKIPFIGHYFWQPGRFAFLLTFASAVLAAFGLDYMLENPTVFKYRFAVIYRKILRASISLLVLGNFAYLLLRSKLLAIAYSYFDSHKYAQTIGLPKEYYHGLIQITVDKLFNNVSLLNVDIVVCVVLLACVLPLIRLVHHKNLFANTVLCLVAANLIIVGAAGHSFGSRSILETEPHFAEIIRSHEKDPLAYRTFSYMIPFAQYQLLQALHPDAFEEGFVFSREALIGNLNFFSNIQIAGGYEPIAFRRYQSLLYEIESVSRDVTEKGRNEDVAQKMNLISMMNIKYFISPYAIANPNLKLLEKENVTRYSLPLYLYENNDVMPPAYFAKNIEFLREGAIDENFKKVATSSVSFKNTTFIECNNCLNAHGTTGTITISTTTSASTDIQVRTDSPGWLVLSRANVPTWKAMVDGKETRIYFANHTFQAIEIPAGEHSVSFTYSPII